jgi:hypothetical protein
LSGRPSSHFLRQVPISPYARSEILPSTSSCQITFAGGATSGGPSEANSEKGPIQFSCNLLCSLPSLSPREILLFDELNVRGTKRHSSWKQRKEAGAQGESRWEACYSAPWATGPTAQGLMAWLRGGIYHFAIRVATSKTNRVSRFRMGA